MGNGARITKSIRHFEKMKTSKTYQEECKKKNKIVYENSKKKLNNRCANVKCRKILAPKTKGNFCKSCHMKEVWKERKKGGGIYGFIKL